MWVSSGRHHLSGKSCGRLKSYQSNDYLLAVPGTYLLGMDGLTFKVCNMSITIHSCTAPRPREYRAAANQRLIRINEHCFVPQCFASRYGDGVPIRDDAPRRERRSRTYSWHIFLCLAGYLLQHISTSMTELRAIVKVGCSDITCEYQHQLID